MVRLNYEFLTDEANKELNKKKHLEVVKCDVCGDTVTKLNLNRHKKSKRHLDWVKAIEEDSADAADAADAAKEASTNAPEKENSEPLDTPEVVDLERLLSFKLPRGIKRFTLALEM